jgi:hypothetical protein
MTIDIDEFRRAMRRIPPPVSCYSNGAVCPWCGWIHKTITFGKNCCLECNRPFRFGYPKGGWHEGKDPISWVDFPFREFEAVGGRSAALENWVPNEQLKEIYFEKSEESLGVFAAQNPKQ